MKWVGPSIEHAWKNWCVDSSYRRIKSLPLVVAWGVWLARNSSIFKDNTPTPDIIVAKVLIILSHLRQEKKERAIRIPPTVQIDHSFPLDYFDGLPKIPIRSVGEALFSTWKKLIILIFLWVWGAEQTTLLNFWLCNFFFSLLKKNG